MSITTSSFIMPPFRGAVKWIIIINVAIFVLQELLIRLLPGSDIVFNNLVLRNVIYSGSFLPWQPLTYMFLHGDFWHLLMNMFMLWITASSYENDYGSKKFLQLYFIAGIGTGFLEIFILDNVIGASAAVFACLISFAYFRPNARILFMFLFPIRVVIFVALLILVELFSMIQATGNVAHSAHLIGAAIGFIFLQVVHGRYPFLNWFHVFFQKQKEKNQKKKLRFDLKINNNEEKVVNKDQWVQDKVDELLDKVSKGGIGSLTKKEKEFLDKVSMNYQSKNDDNEF